MSTDVIHAICIGYCVKTGCWYVSVASVYNYVLGLKMICFFFEKSNNRFQKISINNIILIIMSIFHLWEIYPLIYRCELIYSDPTLLPFFSNLRSHQCHFDDVYPENFLIMSIFHSWEIYKSTLYIDELNEFDIVILLPYKAMYVLLRVVSMMYLLRYIKRNFWGSVCHYITSPYSNIHSLLGWFLMYLLRYIKSTILMMEYL